MLLYLQNLSREEITPNTNLLEYVDTVLDQKQKEGQFVSHIMWIPQVTDNGWAVSKWLL